MVEKKVQTGLSYLEACVAVADEMDIEDHEIIKFISVGIRDKIEVEAIEQRTIKVAKQNTLDFLM